MRDAGWSFYFIYLFFVWRFVALRIAFMGHWGGTLVAFTVLVIFLLGIGVGRLWRFSAFVAFMRHAGWSVYFIYLFIYLFFYCVAWRGVAFRVAFMGHWGGALVASTAFVAFMRRLGWSPFCGI